MSFRIMTNANTIEHITAGSITELRMKFQERFPDMLIIAYWQVRQ